MSWILKVNVLKKYCVEIWFVKYLKFESSLLIINFNGFFNQLVNPLGI